MALTHSTMLELGTPVPDFQLPEVVSGTIRLPLIYSSLQLGLFHSTECFRRLLNVPVFRDRAL